MASMTPITTLTARRLTSAAQRCGEAIALQLRERVVKFSAVADCEDVVVLSLGDLHLEVERAIARGSGSHPKVGPGQHMAGRARYQNLSSGADVRIAARAHTTSAVRSD